MNLNTSILILLLLSGIFMIFPDTKHACAGPQGGAPQIADQTCDTQVWLTMENRARLETEREIMQNQNLIFKADSILNYTCFDSFAAHAARNVGVLFTHTSYFGGSPILQYSTQYGMDTALDNVVRVSMNTYITSNFNHHYLGGRGQFLGLNDMPVVNAIPQGGAQYECDVMAEVWRVAKCVNFIHNQNFAQTDGFYPFIDIQGMNGNQDVAGYANASINDTRRFPTQCSEGPIAGSTWELLYRHSRNETGFGANDYHYQYGNPLRETFTDIRELVEPAVCADPIPTGVMVILGPGVNAERYLDGVCTNPGCSYRRGGANALGTCTTASPAPQGGGGNQQPAGP